MTEKELNQYAQQQIESLEEVIEIIRERGPYSALMLIGVHMKGVLHHVQS